MRGERETLREAGSRKRRARRGGAKCDRLSEGRLRRGIRRKSERERERERKREVRRRKRREQIVFHVNVACCLQ